MTVKEKLIFPEFKGAEGVPGLRGYTTMLVKAALAEDVGGGDVTTDAVVEKSRVASCSIIAREDLVLAGLFVAEKVFKTLDRKARFESHFKDGDRVRKNKAIATVTGRFGPLLTAERVALNFLQRLSGIATLTSMFVDRVKGTNVRILDTRKTTPCMRMLEKYAVTAGGGSNHRFGLSDQILIKDNHISAAGGIKAAVEKVRKVHGPDVLVEVEVTNLRETNEALRADADIIMLDNMSPARIRGAIAVIKGAALVEVSGGVNLDNVREYAETGVDFISVGALTHSASSMDISMEAKSP